jgi:hypothetical protein
MIKGLIKAAADLDRAGFYVEADLMDKIMQKVAENLSDDEEESAEMPDEDDSEEGEEDESGDNIFGFIDGDDSEEEEEEEDSESSDHSVEECLSYCQAFSHEDKVELIKALLDSMM